MSKDKKINRLESYVLGPMRAEILKDQQDLYNKKKHFAALQAMFNELTDSNMPLTVTDENEIMAKVMEKIAEEELIRLFGVKNE